jgi:hypothetical protein
MKKFFVLFLLFLGFLKFSLAGEYPKAKIYIYRQNNFYASGVSYKIFANDSLIVRLKNNSYVIYDCLPGDYIFSINKLSENSIKFKVENGKTYFIKFNVNMGFWSTKPELLLLQDTTLALSQINNEKLKLITDNPRLPFIRPKSRIGVNLAFGGGLHSTAMFYTNVGNASLSSGGGYGIGAKYGYEITNYLDIALDFNYQFSFLIPYLNNATSTFKRGYISITPSYIIPLQDGERMRLKIGGGYDYYFDNMVIIGGINVPNGGFNDTWKYDKTSGWHACVNYELNFSDKMSLNFGVKYYNVKYSFKSSSLMIPSDDSGLKNPDGSGVDILMGVFYHF